MIRRSTDPPTDDKISTSFKLSAAVHRELKIAAATEGRDMSELVTDALKAYLSKSESDRAARND